MGLKLSNLRHRQTTQKATHNDEPYNQDDISNDDIPKHNLTFMEKLKEFTVKHSNKSKSQKPKTRLQIMRQRSKKDTAKAKSLFIIDDDHMQDGSTHDMNTENSFKSQTRLSKFVDFLSRKSRRPTYERAEVDSQHGQFHSQSLTI
jgi:hypothetical protein